ncbi:MAG: diadenosine tetraphosphate hydrolase [Euryarchaeota archaeon]|nr:diadenosine tetraphosphate hydrolase [Euryarchaeota archaeon]
METSCGVVLVNLGAVLLLQYPQGHWDFPKGHIEASDAGHKATVRREVREETGIVDVAFVDGFHRRTFYTYIHKGRTVEKEVHWYLAETEALEVVLSREHRGHLWLDWDAAASQLTHEAGLQVLQSARAHMKQLGRD